MMPDAVCSYELRIKDSYSVQIPKDLLILSVEFFGKTLPTFVLFQEN